MPSLDFEDIDIGKPDHDPPPGFGWSKVTILSAMSVVALGSTISSQLFLANHLLIGLIFGLATCLPLGMCVWHHSPRTLSLCNAATIVMFLCWTALFLNHIIPPVNQTIKAIALTSALAILAINIILSFAIKRW